MIPQNICSQTLTVGPTTEGKGGISILIRSISSMYAPFRSVVSQHEGNKLRKLAILLGAELRLIYLCAFGRIRIVHIHTASYTDFRRNALFLRTAKLFGKKVLLHIHGAQFEEFYSEQTALVQRVCRRADMLATVSNHFVEFLRDKRLNDRVRLLHNLTGRPTILPKAKTDPRLRFLYVGAVDERKGIFDVLECLAEHKDYFADKIVYEIAGTGETDRMHEFIRQNGMESFVRYLGWVDACKKQECFSQADVFIHPSRFESFGIAILEGMSYRLPIITTGVGGIPDLVTDGVNGIVTAAGDKESIRMAMQRLIEDETLRTRMGDASGRLAENFYPEKIERDLTGLYLELLQSDTN